MATSNFFHQNSKELFVKSALHRELHKTQIIIVMIFKIVQKWEYQTLGWIVRTSDGL